MSSWDGPVADMQKAYHCIMTTEEGTGTLSWIIHNCDIGHGHARKLSIISFIACYICYLSEYHRLYINENHDIAVAMSPSRADPVLELNILQG